MNARPGASIDSGALPAILQTAPRTNSGTIAAFVATALGAILMMVPGLLLIVAYLHCLTGCINPGGPGYSPGQNPGPFAGYPLQQWLDFGGAQILLGGLLLAPSVLLLARPGWHVILGAAILGASVAYFWLAVIAPWYAPPIGFLAGLLGGTFAMVWAKAPPSPTTRSVRSALRTKLLK